jgi:hypothetical protein
MLTLNTDRSEFLPTPKESRKVYLLLIWTPIAVVISLVVVAMGILYYQNNILSAPLANFDQMDVSNGFHHISLASGQHWDVSYEQSHDRVFEGVVRHTSMDHEPNFPIISFDILITSGDYVSPSLVTTDVTDHHFTWESRTGTQPQGTINLLHTVPMNQAMEEQLIKIKDGDTVIVQGWDVLKIDGYDKNGKYIGYWTDEGCNTTLVTSVTIK